jgi:hypothetical protein
VDLKIPWGFIRKSNVEIPSLVASRVALLRIYVMPYVMFQIKMNCKDIIFGNLDETDLPRDSQMLEIFHNDAAESS